MTTPFFTKQEARVSLSSIKMVTGKGLAQTFLCVFRVRNMLIDNIYMHTILSLCPYSTKDNISREAVSMA